MLTSPRLTSSRRSLALVALSACVALLPLVMSPAFAQTSPQAISLFEQGVKAYNDSQFGQSIQFFEEAVRLDPSFVDGWYNLGSVQYRAGNFNKAAQAYQQVIRLRNKDFQARFNYGLALEQLGQNREAIDAYRSIPADHPRFVRAQEKIAKLEQNLNQRPVVTNNRPNTPNNSTANPNSNEPFPVEPFAQELHGPTGMAIGANGEIYIANYSQNSIVKILPGGQKTTLVKDKGLGGPIGLVRDPSTGDLFVANYLKNNILRVDDNGQLSVLASGLNKPYNLLLDTLSNTLYVSEQETNTVSRIKL